MPGRYCKDLNCLHGGKKLNRLRNIDTYLLDLDGTFYLGNTLYPWSLPFVNTMKNLGKRFVFVTNNSSQNAKHYLHKIRNMGVDITEDQVFTSGQATIYYLKKHNYPRKLYLVGTPALEEEFQEAGFILTDRDPQTVVLGFDLTLTYEKLKTACSLIREGVPFIATHPDFNCPTPEGPIPDCGAMIALITASTGVKPKIIGKPYPEMIEALRAKYGLEDPGKIAMVGDRLYTDMAMAKAAGIVGILVLSGETQLKDLEHSQVQPDLVLENLGEIVEALS
ncbi:MAG: HAD-IIA family hydrolase [Firmicutes bacterium]|nr:HAD-IIA family hydrolase [Bacillota bacterium]